jgi:hypothetical protein
MVTPPLRDERGGRGREDPDVESEADAPRVFDIEVGAEFHRPFSSRRDLPQSRQPRLDVMPFVLPRLVPRHDGREFGPGADQAHLPAGHVEELRQLIQAPPAQETADGRMPGVGAGLVRAPAIGKGNRHVRPAPVGEHGPELQDVERDAMPADPLLTENHARAEVDPDDKRDKRQDRSRH